MMCDCAKRPLSNINALSKQCERRSIVCDYWWWSIRWVKRIWMWMDKCNYSFIIILQYRWIHVFDSYYHTSSTRRNIVQHAIERHTRRRIYNSHYNTINDWSMLVIVWDLFDCLYRTAPVFLLISNTKTTEQTNDWSTAAVRRWRTSSRE